MDVTIHGDALDRLWNDDEYGRVSLQCAAFDGEVGSGVLIVPDPNDIDDYLSGHSVLVEEDGVPVFMGWVLNHDRDRGSSFGGIEHNYATQDVNALLYAQRVIWKRDSETDVDRVLAFAARYLPTADTTWVLDSNHFTLPTKKYDGEGWDELIADIVDFTSKTLFLHHTNAGGLCLHYHLFTTGHTSGLTINDSPSVINGTGHTFVPGDPHKSTDGTSLGTDVRAVDQEDRVAHVVSTTGPALYDTDGLVHEKNIVVEATSQADLDNIALNALAEMEDPLDTWTCSIGPLDSSDLALIKAGDLITVTSQVMELSGAAKRISHITLRPYPAGPHVMPTRWMADLELGRPVRRGYRGRSSKEPKNINDSVPPAPGNSPACVYPGGSDESTWFYTNVNEDPPYYLAHIMGGGAFAEKLPCPQDTEGSADAELRFTTGDTAFFAVPGYYAANYSFVTDAPDSSPTYDYIGGNVRFGISTAGASLSVTLSHYSSSPGGSSGADDTITIAASGAVAGEGTFNLSQRLGSGVLRIAVAAGGACTIYVGPDSFNVTPSGDLSTGAESFVFFADVGNATILGGAQESEPYKISAVINGLAFVSDSGTPMPWCGPVPSQDVLGEYVGTGDGSTTAFTTNFPYQPGTLRIVMGGGLDEHNITETNPSTGAFSFSSPPFDGEVIRAYYRGG